MKESSSAYIPRDRLMALVSGRVLPSKSSGAVLFADISGFTPLTEAFEAHLGARLGGEELTRILNKVYAMLIGEVDKYRGSVIGFAGDAITCWFEGDDGRKAVAGALAMQSGMDGFKAIKSPGGETIALGLKAAVTTGTVKRFVVGNGAIQWVDVMAGDPVYQVAVIEGMAQRGEVLIDKQTQQAMGEDVVTHDEREMEGISAFVVRALRTLPESDPWPAMELVNVPEEVSDPWMISAIRKRMATGLGDFFTELRPATAMFVKFEGIDFEKDADADEKLNGFFVEVQALVDQYGGVVHQLTVGDKGSFLYAAFGAPISHEDDTQRAMAVALKIRTFARSLEFITAVRIGIARGSTRTGAYGGPTRRTYGVLGDQVNLSARLMGKAEPWQILVSDRVAGEGRKVYDLTHLPAIMVKGKSHPIDVYRLNDVAKEVGWTQNQSGYAIPVVGRSTELARLRTLIERVRWGLGYAVSIVADAGLGKTRLVDEVIQAATASGYRILHGECLTFGTNTIYTPWWRIWRGFFGVGGEATAEEIEEIVRSRLALVDESFVARLPLLSPVLNCSLPDNELTRTFDAQLRRASMEALLVDCLRSASEKQPILIVLEDAHAIDPVSRDLLRVLIQAIARLPVMIVIAHRPTSGEAILSSEEEGLVYTNRLELAELSDEEAAELIRLKFDQLYGIDVEIPHTVIERIAERTGRNPFFIEEVMNWIHHEKINIRSADALNRAELPVSLYALMLSRMDQLDENARVTMKVASVVGRVFRAAVIWGVYPELGGEYEILAALDALSRNDFTEREEGSPELAYLFKHVVMHEVAYESLPKELRARLHEAIGLFVEKNVPLSSLQVLDILAFHFGRSENVEKQRKYFLEAADAARLAYANKAAAGHYKAVLPLLEPFDQVPVLQNLGLVLEFSGDWDRAMTHYEEALALSRALKRRINEAHCKLHIGEILRKKGSFEEAGKWLRDAETSYIALKEEQGIGQALHSLGTLSAQTGDYDRARNFYTRSMEIRRRLGDEAKVASLLSNIGIITRFQGELNQALMLQQESLAIRRKINDAWAIGNSLNNLGMAKRYLGDLSAARKDLEEALTMLEKVGDRAETANTLNSLAEVALDQNDLEASTDYLQESLQLRRELGNTRALAYLFEAFASVAFRQVRVARCLVLLGAAKALRATIGAPLPESDQAEINKTLEKAGKSLADGTGELHLTQGASFSLIEALDFAANNIDPT